MSPLKLFISHSSRLDDVEHQWTDKDRNWKLLGDTCKAIRGHYGDRVEVLVDQDGLIPGEDWNHRLNLWLAECHAAIILFSKRAIDKSNWVAKEAAILSWRAELDDQFKLIPVLLDGETAPEDLAKDFLGTLKIDRSQCIRNAQTADDIVAGLAAALGAPATLSGTYPITPLDSVVSGITKLLNANVDSGSIQKALREIGCNPNPGDPIKRENCAELLAKHFLCPDNDGAEACFDTFQRGLAALTPSPLAEHANWLYRSIRSLWVDAGAASMLPSTLSSADAVKPLSIAGQLIQHADPHLETDAYTLERYLERAWPESRLYKRVTVSAHKDLEDVRVEIRRNFLGSGVPPTIPGTMLDQSINRDPKAIILVLTVRADQGGLPDPAQLSGLRQLTSDYHKLVLLFALEPAHDALPEDIRAIQPPLDLQRETQAYLAECAAKTFLNDQFGI